MNQFDPLKESPEDMIHRDSPDAHANRERNGTEYVSPDGSHGLIYTPHTETKKKKRRLRGIIVAASVTVAVLFVGSCLLFSAWMAATSLGWLWNFHIADGSETTDGIGTSNGLHISDGTTGEGNAELPTDAPDPNHPSNNGSVGGEVLSIPKDATIEKLPPKRQDTNGDGRAEIETDAAGNVITSAGEAPLSVATVVARVAASVVEITTETITRSGQLGQYITGGAGSGVIVSREGFIVTNHHVIDGATSITVRLNDGKEFPARVVGSDERTDIAVLWIDPEDYPLTVAKLGSSFDLVVGEDILAIGNPLGSLGGTVTEGMVSATARQILVNNRRMTLLQVSAPINPGNSGGGLFNLAGELVGIVNAKVSSEEIEGLGFAIPVDTAYEVITELIESGYVRGRPALGFTVVDVTTVQTAVRYFNSMNTGVYVYDESHSVVRYGDLILSADGKEIHTVADLATVIDGKSVGDTMELTVYRAGSDHKNKWEKVTLTVQVTEDIPDTVPVDKN